MHNLTDDRWPDELDAGDPRLADVMREDPSVQVYSAASPIRGDALVGCPLDWEPVRFGFWRGAGFAVALSMLLALLIFAARGGLQWLH